MKKIYTFAASFAAVVMLAGIMSFLRVNAAAATVLPTDVNEPRSGCAFLGIEGKYIAQIQEALDRINEIRLEACKEGVENPSSTGNRLTVNDYVPIQWSADLEYIARLRAAEASVTMAHERLNGESIWGITGPNGVRSYGEVIAWNWSETMVNGINQWYGEKKDWVNKTGGVTGHYTQMIDPKHLYVGLGTFCSESVKYYNTTVGEFCGNLNNPDTSRGKSTGTVIQTLEVQNNLISYEVSGTDTLSVSAVVTVTDYWGNTLKTGGLTLTGASAKAVQWSSSNNDVATVVNGKVTVKKCGSAVITATMPGGKTVKRTISGNHSYKTTSTTAATCKEEGRTVEKCTVCGDTKTTTTPKTNKHSYKTTSNVAATCKEEGRTVEKCTVCGDTKTTTTPKTNKHSYKTTSNVAATCKEEGRIVEKCTVCGDTKTKTTPKTDQHSFGNWVTEKAPTASSDGLEKRTCSVCATEETRTLKYEGSDTSSNANDSSGDNSSSTSSGDNSSSTSSGDNSSSTSSGDNSSSTSSGDNSSATSSGDNSSATSSGDNSSPTSSSDNSSSTSSSGNSSTGSSASLSSDSSSEPSSGDEVQSEDASDGSDVTDTSDASDSGNLNKKLPFLIAGGGVFVAGAIGFVIVLLIKREKKLK